MHKYYIYIQIPFPPDLPVIFKKSLHLTRSDLPT